MRWVLFASIGAQLKGYTLLASIVIHEVSKRQKAPDSGPMKWGFGAIGFHTNCAVVVWSWGWVRSQYILRNAFLDFPGRRMVLLANGRG